MRVLQKRKKWEHKEVNPTSGKPILQKLHVHTGDQVIVIAGADKGIISEVTYVRARALCRPCCALSLDQGFGSGPRVAAFWTAARLLPPALFARGTLPSRPARGRARLDTPADVAPRR